MKAAYLFATLALLAASACASNRPPSAEQAAPLTVIKQDTDIPFANFRRQIQDWTVRTDGTLLFKTSGNRYYHATLFAPCPWLDFANTIAYEPGPGGMFDKFSTLRVQGNTCRLNSLDEVADPRPKKVAPGVAPVN